MKNIQDIRILKKEEKFRKISTNNFRKFCDLKE